MSLPELCRQVQNKVLHSITAERLWAPGDTVVVAVSGGADSLCLLHALLAGREEHGARLHVAHLNHCLRPEAAEEATQVAALAGQWGLPVTVGAVDVPALMQQEGVAAEEAARHARYRFLAGVAQQVGAAAIALGHTADDQAETVLMHLLRGSGLNGLRGMHPRSSTAPWITAGTPPTPPLSLVRPLLDVSHAETEEYCAACGLHPVADPWNDDLRFLRVRLRREVLPFLERINPNFRQALLRLAQLAAWQDDDLQVLLDAEWPGLARQADAVVRLDLSAWSHLSRTLRLLALRRAVERVRGRLEDVGWEALVAAVDLELPVGSEVALVDQVVARREYGTLAVGARVDLLPPPHWPALGKDRIPVAVPGYTDLPDGHALQAELLPWAGEKPPAGGPEEAWVDAERCGRSLWLRHRRPGDRFQPLGMAGQKKVQDFFVDAKVPRAERDTVPLLISPRGIVWIVGYRLDERFRVRPETRQVLHLRWGRK